MREAVSTVTANNDALAFTVPCQIVDASAQGLCFVLENLILANYIP